MGWTMCCVGVPTTLCARKRMASELWGPDVKELKEELKQQEELDEGTIEMEGLGGEGDYHDEHQQEGEYVL